MKATIQQVAQAEADGEVYPRATVVLEDGSSLESNDTRTRSRRHQFLNAEAGPGRAQHRKTMHGAKHTRTDAKHREPANGVLRMFRQRDDAPDIGESLTTLRVMTATPKHLRKARRRAANKIAKASRKRNR